MTSFHRLLLVACGAFLLNVSSTRAFTFVSLPGAAAPTRTRTAFVQVHSPTSTCLSMSDADADDSSTPDQEGASMAAAFFKMAQQKGIGQESLELEDDDEEEEEDDEEEEEDDVSLTNDQLYSEVKERVLDTAGGFLDFVKGANDDEDGEDDDEDGDEFAQKAPKPYEAPLTVPDSELTAGEVVLLVLDALLHNDVPSKNKGVEIVFGYSSPGSSVKNEEGLTPAEYADFLKETEYKVLFDHKGVSIDKGSYSFDGKKGFFTARLSVGPSPLDTVSVNFILSTTGVDDDACWLVDSMLIRPQSMRRRRRK